MVIRRICPPCCADGAPWRATPRPSISDGGSQSLCWEFYPADPARSRECGWPQRTPRSPPRRPWTRWKRGARRSQRRAAGCGGRGRRGLRLCRSSATGFPPRDLARPRPPRFHRVSIHYWSRAALSSRWPLLLKEVHQWRRYTLAGRVWQSGLDHTPALRYAGSGGGFRGLKRSDGVRSRKFLEGPRL